MADRSSLPTIPAGAVKICGLREPSHAQITAEAGADFLGFVFAPSKRQVTAEVARDVIAAVREVSPKPPLAVGVFLNATVDEMNAIADVAGLDMIQLHGATDAIDLSELNRPHFVALHPSPETTQAEVEQMMETAAKASVALLGFFIDGFQPGQYGGLGVRADWSLAHNLATNWPVILAGGLNPENVSEAIATVRPLGVDVSSGVETDGVKDPVKMRAFIKNAKRAFALGQR